MPLTHTWHRQYVTAFVAFDRSLPARALGADLVMPNVSERPSVVGFAASALDLDEVRRSHMGLNIARFKYRIRQTLVAALDVFAT
ncbi:hypothetical protein VTO73DRAFT_867 [Trametes versicolor]